MDATHPQVSSRRRSSQVKSSQVKTKVREVSSLRSTARSENHTIPRIPMYHGKTLPLMSRTRDRVLFTSASRGTLALQHLAPFAAISDE